MSNLEILQRESLRIAREARCKYLAQRLAVMLENAREARRLMRAALHTNAMEIASQEASHGRA